MIEKIDKPNAPPAYRITEAKQTKESLHQGQGSEEERGQGFQKESEQQLWGKFHARTITIRPMRVPRSRIAQVLFKATVLRNGAATLITDLVWTNGQRTEGALFLLRRLEDYFRLKGFRPGSEVPESFWAFGDEIELGIPQDLSSSGKFYVPAEKKISEKHRRFTVQQLQWGLIVAMTIGLLVIAIATWQEFQ